MAILDTSSEIPFVDVFNRAEPSKLGFTSRKGVLLGKRKNTKGMVPPTIWPINVASAAPKIPHFKMTIKTRSNKILVTPATTVTIKLSFGRSATIKNNRKYVGI